MVSVYDFKVKCDECGEVGEPDHPQNRIKWVIGMALVFAGIGLLFGSAVGIATAGFGIVASFVTVPLGAYCSVR